MSQSISVSRRFLARWADIALLGGALIMLAGCSESVSYPEPPPRVDFTGHPEYVRDVNHKELDPGMKLNWSIPIDSMRPHNYQIIQSGAIRYGTVSERFELREGDCYGGDCLRPRQNERLQRLQTDTLSRNKKYFYYFSFYVPISNVPVANIYFPFQIQQSPSWVPIFMFAKQANGELCMLKTPTLDQNFVCEIGTDFPLISDEDFAGKWHDFKMEIVFHETSGSLKLFRSGTLVADYRGQTVFAGHQPHFNYGLYRPKSPHPTEIYFDEVKFSEVDIAWTFP